MVVGGHRLPQRGTVARFATGIVNLIGISGVCFTYQPPRVSLSQEQEDGWDINITCAQGLAC